MGIRRQQQLAKTQSEAWIGDAVLALYVREMLLHEYGEIDGAAFSTLTSNKFLLLFGNPTEIEAAIGRAYLSGQLAHAYEWINAELLPKMKGIIRSHTHR